MKIAFHLAAFALVVAGMSTSARADTVRNIVGTSLASSTMSFDAANRKGSKRTGGTNSKGKGSKYRGGRR